MFFVCVSSPTELPTYTAHPYDERAYAAAVDAGALRSNDLTSWKQACAVAASITKHPDGSLARPGDYIPVDHGAMNTWPRYDVVRAWKVGDAARMVFNGGGFDCGNVLRVTGGTVRVSGRPGPRGGRKPLTFKRVGRSGVWKRGAFHLARA